MPRIILKYFAYIADLVKKREESIDMPENTTVQDLLEVLIKVYGTPLREYIYPEPNRELNPVLNFLVNKVNIHNLEGLGTSLKEADEFVILPPVGGG